MQRAYPNMSEDHVLRRLPMTRGWAYYAWAIENDPWTNAKREGKGYVAQEITRRMKILNAA